LANPTGESNFEVLRLDFDRRLMLQFHGSVVTSDAGDNHPSVAAAPCRLEFRLSSIKLSRYILSRDRRFAASWREGKGQESCHEADRAGKGRGVRV
jgi:hypothetical protein